MTVLINGEHRRLKSAGTVRELVEELGLAAPTILVEHNGIALHRNEWETTALTEGDVIEILKVVAGG